MDSSLNIGSSQVKKGFKISKSSFFLILANIIPIIGIFFAGWSIFGILFAYWLENIVVGFYAVLKILTAQCNRYNGTNGSIFIKAFIVPFFIFHFGLFTMGHGVFLFALFGERGGFFNISNNIFLLVVSFFMLMISHGVSYWQNYIKNGEYLKTSPDEAMAAPYSRIIVMHLSVMVSGFVFVLLGFNIITNILIVAFKTTIDFNVHNREHRKLSMRQLNTLN